MLTTLLLEDLPDNVGVWMRRSLETNEVGRVRRAFLAARSIIGSNRWCPNAAARELLAQNRLAWACTDTKLDEIARVLFTLRAERLSSHPEIMMQQWFTSGGPDERRSVLRALPLVSRPKQHLELALSAARGSDEMLVEAIGCENPYPAAYFGDHQFSELLDHMRELGLDPARVLDATPRMAARFSWADSDRPGGVNGADTQRTSSRDGRSASAEQAQD
ncbi:MAG: EboA domain-containing protein [Polyangiaceae bacterium]|nr:EboA domain-containing protein [Polyangiaceae bacterium]